MKDILKHDNQKKLLKKWFLDKMHKEAENEKNYAHANIIKNILQRHGHNK